MAFACADIDTLVHTYLDGELAAHDLEDLELHIAGCAACKARVDDELQFRAELRQKLAPPRAPDLLRARVSALLDAEDRAATTAQRKRNLAWVLPGAASVAAAAALVLVFALPQRGEGEHAQPQPANGNEPPAPGSGKREPVDLVAKPMQVQLPDFAALGAKPRAATFQEGSGAEFTYDWERNHARHEFRLAIIPNGRDAVQANGQRIMLRDLDLDDFEVWSSPFGGQTAITILRGSNAFIFRSGTMSRDQLVEIIKGGGWLRAADPHPEP